MRQRKVKNEEARLAALEHLQIKNSRDLPREWQKYVKSYLKEFAGDIYMELGCGRGHFLNAHAKERTEDFFLGVEGRSSVVLRALELTHENQLNNLLFMCNK